MRLGFFGTPQLAARYLEAVARHHEVVGVVTQPDRAQGRSGQPQPSPVKQLAMKLGIPVVAPQPGQCLRACQELAQQGVAVCVVVAFGQKIPCACPELSGHTFVNVHYSLLPQLRGAAPVQHAILQGLKRTGVTIQHLAAGWDEGDIILQQPVDILPDDTTSSLTERLTPVGIDLLLRALELLAAGTAPRIPQDHSQATYAPLLRKSDGIINWEEPADLIERKIRAFDPWPGAVTRLRGKDLKLLRARVEDGQDTGGQPGQVVELNPDDGFVVCCGSGRLRIERLQAAGRRSLEAAEFLRGARLSVGDRLG